MFPIIGYSSINLLSDENVSYDPLFKKTVFEEN